jgi:hypothetical protein
VPTHLNISARETLVKAQIAPEVKNNEKNISERSLWNEKKIVILHADYIRSNSRGCRKRSLWPEISGATDG